MIPGTFKFKVGEIGKAPTADPISFENVHHIQTLVDQLLFALQELPETAAVELDRTRLRQLLTLLRTHASTVELLIIGCVRLDGETREVVVADRRESLTRREFELLHVLMRHPGETLSRQQILGWVWGDARRASGNLVDVYIRYLRNKLRPLGVATCLETIRGAGYQFQPLEAPQVPSARR